MRQPAFVQLKNDQPNAYRVVGDLHDSDQIMNNTLFLGTYPGLTTAMIHHEIEVIKNFCGLT